MEVLNSQWHRLRGFYIKFRSDNNRPATAMASSAQAAGWGGGLDPFYALHEIIFACVRLTGGVKVASEQRNITENVVSEKDVEIGTTQRRSVKLAREENKWGKIDFRAEPDEAWPHVVEWTTAPSDRRHRSRTGTEQLVVGSNDIDPHGVINRLRNTLRRKCDNDLKLNVVRLADGRRRAVTRAGRGRLTRIEGVASRKRVASVITQSSAAPVQRHCAGLETREARLLDRSRTPHSSQSTSTATPAPAQTAPAVR
ncbi:hypothetical protein EVAR_36847_1 [Eumeta japonica]|uniref:Uncharacterized protein n=1 Tax=Eumeta variegata TaxID=151549 RepID=A0A4C1WBI7_EUMVA|nr:hypothetical protein EVAR_36847_1 [Eumeta japonica]